MEAGYSVRDCGCEKSCEEVQYSVGDISLQPVDSSSECMWRTPELFKTVEYFIENGVYTKELDLDSFTEGSVALLLAEKIR